MVANLESELCMFVASVNSVVEPVAHEQARLPGAEQFNIEGLDAILDRIFQNAPSPVSVVSAEDTTVSSGTRSSALNSGANANGCNELQDFSPGGIFDSTRGEIISGSEPSTAGDASMSPHSAELLAMNKLMSAQLDYAKSELDINRHRVQWLESQLALREEQVAVLPELFARAGTLCQVEKEVAGLQQILKSEREKTGNLERFSRILRSTNDELTVQLIIANNTVEQLRAEHEAKLDEMRIEAKNTIAQLSIELEMVSRESARYARELNCVRRELEEVKQSESFWTRLINWWRCSFITSPQP